MARTALCVLLCACLFVTVTRRSLLAADDPDKRTITQLRVNQALAKGKAYLQVGNHAAAVAVLEKEIPYIDGNSEYLVALQTAYRGHVQELEQSGKQTEAKRFRGFLAILDPRERPSRTDAAALPALPVPESPAKPALTPRAKVEEDDPFHKSNSAEFRSRGYLDQAEQEFKNRHYEEAARLYGLAERQAPGSTSTCKERWAYCRLASIGLALNNGTSTTSREDLERQITQAMQTDPRLHKFGQSLLEQVRSGAGKGGARVEIKHTPRQGAGWAVAETSSFRIFHAGSEEEAEKIARIVESTRVSMSRKWLGEEARAWTPRCDIYVHPTAAAYARETGAPTQAPGHSTISLDAGRVISRRVDLRADNPQMLTHDLPHETTHVVLAGRFGNHHIPRWADEGMAVLSEPGERVDLHLRNLATYHRESTLFPVRELMQMDDYPKPQRIGAFYAQSVALVHFLVQKKDALTFTRFLRAALDSKPETALQTYFGYNSFTELEQDWTQYALGNPSVATAAGKPKR